MNGGGIMFSTKSKESCNIFNYYLDNLETVTMISNGVFGAIFLLELPDSLNVTNENKHLFYRKMTPSSEYGDYVKQLVVKYQHVDKLGIGMMRLGGGSLTAIEEPEFQNEINIQTDVVLKTMKYLQPLCPSVIYAEIINDDVKKNNLYEKLIAPAKNLDIDVSNFRFYNMGIIVMEMVHNSSTLYSYVDDEPNNATLAENVARYAVLKLALDTEYNHGDFHKGNILIQTDSSYFLSSNKGPTPISPMLIDFGRTSKINPSIMKLIRDSVKNKNYTKALSYLCDAQHSNEYVRDIQYKSYYGWVCGNYNVNTDEDISNYPTDWTKLSVEINNEIDTLFVERELALNKNVETMNQLNSSNPEKYPLIPVSNKLKNKLYSGMIGGKMHNKKRYTRNKRRKNKKRSVRSRIRY